MNKDFIDTLADEVIKRLSRPMVEVEASGRHIHLSRKAVDILFGEHYSLTKKSNLSQPGQFACNERVTLMGPKRSIENVIILGPERAETQVEISSTDALTLGIKAPVRMSGNIAGTPGAKLIGPAGELVIDSGVIVAKRHIHMTPNDAARLNITDGESVDVEIPGDRATTFHNVTVRVSSSFATYMHIDYDEANACGHHKGMMAVIKKQSMPTL